jgi:hypothetical protein
MTPLQENHITTQTRDGQKQAFVADVVFSLSRDGESKQSISFGRGVSDQGGSL